MSVSLIKNKALSNYEWWKFVHEDIEPQGVRDCIVASWKRCKALDVNPYEEGYSIPLCSETEISDRIKEKSSLINIIKPHIENMYKYVQGSGSILFFTDEEATVLHIAGDNQILDDYRAGCNFWVGANWSEKNVGTSSIGMVLTEGEPIQIAGEEHYCLRYQTWTCSGVPVRNSQGTIIAVISMVEISGKVYPHTLAMLAASAMAIENQLQVQETTEKLQVAVRYHKAMVESVSEGIVWIDRDGYVVTMNKSAGRILYCNPQESIGKHVTEVVDYRPAILDVLKTGKGYIDKEFIMNSKRGQIHFVKSAVPIRGENGEIDGVVDVFREIKQVKRLVNKMVGAQARFTFNDIIGISKELAEVKRVGLSAARCSSNVLITGESGTGKELFAQAIHNASVRADGPFVAVNCGAIPRELIESEFFGYEEGSFTGAKQGGRPGKFEMASSGTLFLDEIGEMPMDMQVRLLRVLQEKEVTRLGGDKTFPVNVKIIAATNKDLSKEMEEGTFRRDLFWRLNVLVINIPSLNQRSGDIPVLVEHFLNKLSRAHNISYMLDHETLDIINNYSWPGNVRELENVLERAVNLIEGNTIYPRHLPKNMVAKNGETYSPPNALSMEHVEKKAIFDVIKHSKGNISRAAQILGLSRTTLYSKMKKYGLEC